MIPRTSSTSLPREPLTLVRGSLRSAYRTFWAPWGERSGPVVAHIGLALGLNALVALFIALGVAAFDAIPVASIFWNVLPFSESIGLCVMVAYAVSSALIGAERLRRLGALATLLYWGSLSAGGCYFGFLIGSLVRFGGLTKGWNPVTSISLSASLALGMAISMVIHHVASTSGRARDAQLEADRERVRSLAAEARAAQANLKLLQAQIEPHFLFNTLANVVGLIDNDPAEARAMLEDLNRYLRATLALTRQDSTTLGAEAELMQAYLSIFRYRMGQRLSFSIDIDAALHAVPIAPMLLQPIVENALKHGLEPKISGGSVTLRAAREPDGVRVEIADSGLGFNGAPRAGFGLANVRERLRLLYGDAGRLEILDNPGGGTLVTLAIPVGPGA